MTVKCVRVRIEGRVQGVWFRGWTRQQAQALDIDGWVRNNPDGSVEAVLCGEMQAVDDMVTLCRKGPPMAHVARVNQSLEITRPGPGFHHQPADHV